MKVLISIIVIISLSFSFYSQGDFLPARPSQSMGSKAVGEKNLMIESGFSFQEGAINNSTMIRFGIMEKLELNMVIGNGYENQFNKVTNRGLQLALRMALLSGEKSSIGYEIRVKQHEDFSNISSPFYSLEAISAHDFVLAPKLDLTINYGFVKNLVENGATSVNYTVKPTYHFNNNQFFIESFGNVVADITNIDIGYARTIKDKIQVDVGFGLNDLAKTNTPFGVIGASWKINKN